MSAGMVTSVESQDFVELDQSEPIGGKVKPSDIIGLASPIPVIGPFAGLASGILRLFGGSLETEGQKKQLGFTRKEMDTLQVIHDRAVSRAKRTTTKL